MVQICDFHYRLRRLAACERDRSEEWKGSVLWKEDNHEGIQLIIPEPSFVPSTMQRENSYSGYSKGEYTPVVAAGMKGTIPFEIIARDGYAGLSHPGSGS